MSTTSTVPSPQTPQLAAQLFPGKHVVTVAEIAQAWGCATQHVTNLIESGDLLAIDIRTSHVRVTEKDGSVTFRKHKSRRQWLRIPTSAYDAFVTRRGI